jgi:hypothetical protein
MQNVHSGSKEQSDDSRTGEESGEAPVNLKVDQGLGQESWNQLQSNGIPWRYLMGDSGSQGLPGIS